MPTLDVREALRAGEEPLPRILAFVASLPPGTAWRLRATFEPIPLLRLMAGKGYHGTSRRLAEGDWEVLFAPGAGPAEQTRAAAEGEGGPPPDAPARRLDNRGLPPPEPMIRVLEALETLPPGEVLEVFNDREPAFLYPELTSRGWRHATERLPDAVRIRIWRASDPVKEEDPMNDPIIDVRELPHGKRHDIIFAAVAALQGDEGVVVVNDHDPKPLRYQLEALYGPTLRWTYLQSGPDEWRVRIGRSSGA
jgi:uncharacterized protein (DUF2249 family)